MSTNPTINQNLFTAKPEMKDLMDLLKKDVMLSLNCHHIGTVQSFDPETQTCTATINYTKTYFQINTETNLLEPIQYNYPLLLDCPAIVLGGGSAVLTFPIKKGDECLVLFNDRSLDNWLHSGIVGPVASARLHDFSDGIILVGLRSSQKVIQNYDSVRAVLRNGNALVGVGTDLIKIANNITTLNSLLQSLVTAITSITVLGVQTGGGTSGPITNAAAFTALATQIGQLLE